MGDMHKKNMSDSQASHNKKPSGSRLKKITPSAVLLAGVLSITPSMAQLSGPSSDLHQKHTSEHIDKKIDIAHDTFVTMDVEDIIRLYGREQGMEMVNTHIAIQINILRQTMQAPELVVSEAVQQSAQNQSDYLATSQKLQHMGGDKILRKRLRNLNIPFTTCGENLAQWQHSIKRLIDDWMTSPWHKANLLNPEFRKIWIWYTDWKRVYIAID